MEQLKLVGKPQIIKWRAEKESKISQNYNDG